MTSSSHASSSYLVRIPFNEFTFETMRSRGPGGQNVNRTNSAVVLRWTVANSAAFNEGEKARIQARLSHLITMEGDLIIRSEVHRSQDQNRKACLEKLEAYLQKAFFVPKTRFKTKPTRSSVRKRVESKRHASGIKSLRKKPGRENHE